MIRLLAVSRHEGELHAVIAGPIFELCIVVLPNPFSPGLNPFAHFQLSVEERCQNIGKQIAGTDVHPRVLVHFAAKEAAAVGAFLSNDLGALDKARVVDQQSSAFAAGEILSLVKAQGSQATQGTQRPAPISAEQTVRVIFDHRHAVPLGNIENGVHLAADAGVMNDHNGPGTRRDETFQMRLIKIKRVRPDVYKDGPSTAQDESINGGNERERRDDYLV